MAPACRYAILALALKWIWVVLLLLATRLVFGLEASVSQATLPAWGLALLTVLNLEAFGLL